MPATSMVGGRIPTSHCWPGQGVQGALVLYRGRGGFSSLPLYNPPSNPKKPLPQRIAPENCLSHRVSLSLFEKPPKCDFEVIFLKPLKKFIWRFALGFSRGERKVPLLHLTPCAWTFAVPALVPTGARRQLSKVGKEVLGTAARVEVTKDATTVQCSTRGAHGVEEGPETVEGGSNPCRYVEPCHHRRGRQHGS